MNKQELLSCPFCLTYSLRFRGKYPIQVTCNNCGAEGPEAYTIEQAAKAWNLRLYKNIHKKHQELNYKHG